MRIGGAGDSGLHEDLLTFPLGSNPNQRPPEGKTRAIPHQTRPSVQVSHVQQCHRDVDYLRLYSVLVSPLVRRVKVGRIVWQARRFSASTALPLIADHPGLRVVPCQLHHLRNRIVVHYIGRMSLTSSSFGPTGGCQAGGSAGRCRERAAQEGPCAHVIRPSPDPPPLVT